jgi:hypothetical protein
MARSYTGKLNFYAKAISVRGGDAVKMTVENDGVGPNLSCLFSILIRVIQNHLLLEMFKPMANIEQKVERAS